MELDWKPFNEPPKEKFGWFAIAVLPRNHAGSIAELDINNSGLDGDNKWRDKFGFSKGWLNNGEWYDSEPQARGMREVTEYVTHWAYLPKVPTLTEIHRFNGRTAWLNRRQTRQELLTLGHKIWEEDAATNPKPANPHAFAYGIYCAFVKMFGIK